MECRFQKRCPVGSSPKHRAPHNSTGSISGDPARSITHGSFFNVTAHRVGRGIGSGWSLLCIFRVSLLW